MDESLSIEPFDPKKHKKVAMFCTGGIRCEKASVVMMNAGFENVKQLEGGILGYFEETDDGLPRFPVMVGFRLDR